MWRVVDGQLEVLLVHRPRYRDWSWPKGKLDPGESPPAAAVREVAEETGAEVALGPLLTVMRYRLASGRRKRVHYWAASELPADSLVLRARPPAHTSADEVDKVKWMTVEKARRKLTRRADRKPLASLVSLHNRGLLATRPVTVVRHGRAKPRGTWTSGEATRPLTEVGRRQAKALVPLLAAYGADRIVSSPWRRCAATVAPFAKAAKIDLDLVEALTESAHADKPAAAAKVVRRILRGEDAVVVCAHRPVLPTVLATITTFGPRALAAALPRRDPYLKPGQILVAHVATTPRGPRVAALEIQGPPDTHPT